MIKIALKKEMIIMSGTIDRISNLINYIEDEELLNQVRIEESDYTRDSPLNFTNSVLFHINKHGLTNHSELRNFFKKIGVISVSKQAYSKSREKLDPKVFKILKNQHLSEFYGSKEVKTYKNHIIFSGDGSKCTLPYHTKLKDIFGGIKSKFGNITSVAINLTTIYDCLNKYTIEFELDSYNTSEKELINRNMNNIRELNYLKDRPTIFIFDRGLPSLEFFDDMTENDQKFLFRIRKNSYKKEKSKMKTNDEFIDININKTRLNHLKNKELKEKLLQKEKINLRITKVILSSGIEEHLISNLDKETFTDEDLKELYNLRWGIEVSYDSIKNLLHIENVSGYSEKAVKQDFFSQMLAYNIVTDVENTAQNILNEKEDENPKKHKNKKLINKNLLIGIIKEDLIKIACIKNKKIRKKLLKELIEEASKLYTVTSTLEPKRTEKRVYFVKNRSNCRKSF
jgi:hypothetical protein